MDPPPLLCQTEAHSLSRLWGRMCSLLKITRRLSTAFHPETDGSTERMNQELEAYLRCFVSYYQDDWEQLLPVAMLAINGRTSSVTGMSPFFATHGYNIEPIEVEEKLRTTGRKPIAKGEALIAKLQDATEMAQTMIAAAQEKYETYANEHRQPAEQFRVGDKVAPPPNIVTDRPCKKLDWKNAKYTVKELVGSHAVRLDTPPGIHNVFHVMLLRRAADNPLPSQILHEPQPPAVLKEGDSEWYNVEEVLDHKIGKDKKLKLLVKWEGYTKPTWEPEEELTMTEAYATYRTHTDVSKPSQRRKKRRGALSGGGE
ncbi:hypothetical protein P3342_007455 [Pyrenophora teres f. teres]|nr:hypothetical protein P3342_007455 [Pyrenophora teres f. teres]